MLIYLVIGNWSTVSRMKKEYFDLPSASQVTPGFETETVRDLEKTGEKNVAFIMAPEDYSVPFNYYPHFSSPFTGLASHHSDIAMISFSETTWKKSGNALQDEQCLSGIKLGVFYNYVKNKGLNPFSSDLSSLQHQFCEENHIHFLIATPKAQTGELGKSLTLIRTDPNTGLRFFRIE